MNLSRVRNNTTGLTSFKPHPIIDNTLADLRAVILELGIPEVQLKIYFVPDIDTAKRLSFQGSPSILVNRIDIFTGNEPTGFSYGCRLYEFDGKRMGVIPKEFIRRTLVNDKHNWKTFVPDPPNA